MRTESGAEVALSSRDFEKQLGRWRVISDYAASRQQRLLSVDLVVTNYVPVRWQAGAEEGEAPVQLTAAKTKKNV